ncbi:hypothetical protein BJ165DRAFT_1305908, partial [Panaeolus papilionaceus]
MIWIKNCPRPQEVREKLQEKESDFTERLFAWLENCHAGGFLKGSKVDVETRVKIQEQDIKYVDPTLSMPLPPPQPCSIHSEDLASESAACKECSETSFWRKKFEATTDDLIYKSNVHTCERGCKDNRFKKCKARFPRELVNKTYLDASGSIFMKKTEQYLNTFHPTITYLYRCNTDVTSLMSGTAIKAVVMYVTDYITKSSLKTHTIFETIRAQFSKQ